VGEDIIRAKKGIYATEFSSQSSLSVGQLLSVICMKLKPAKHVGHMRRRAEWFTIE